MPRLRLAVLASGRGTNLACLLAASASGAMDAEVALVVCNRPGAGALDVAARHGVPSRLIPSKDAPRDEHDARMMTAIDEAGVDLVVLAGYMRVLGSAFIRRYQGRLVNIHPALLPAFPGLDAQGQAHARGVRIAGCTTHFVTDDVDAGPIIAQAAVAIPPGASAEELRALVLEAEHALYPATIHLLATGRARLDGSRVVHASRAPREGAARVLMSPEVDA